MPRELATDTPRSSPNFRMSLTQQHADIAPAIGDEARPMLTVTPCIVEQRLVRTPSDHHALQLDDDDDDPLPPPPPLRHGNSGAAAAALLPRPSDDDDTGAAKEEEGGAVMRVRGVFPFDGSGTTVLPTKEELNVALSRCWSEAASASRPSSALAAAAWPSPTIVSIAVEDAFNSLHLGDRSANYLLKEQEAYVTFESEYQASLAARLSPIHVEMTMQDVDPTGREAPLSSAGARPQQRKKALVRFERPAHKRSVRAARATIGNLIQGLRTVDTQLRAIGAVPSASPSSSDQGAGIPVLPDNFVQAEVFDIYANECIVRGFKDRLHRWLVSKVRVDRNARQAALERLVDERINILLRLSCFDSFFDGSPFALERAFHAAQ